MKRFMAPALWFVALLLIEGAIPSAFAVEEFEYDGLKKCKGCHKSQYKSWRETAHAKAMRSLEAGVKEEAKTKAKLDPAKDYTEDENCIGCHVTGFGEEGGYEIDYPSKYLVDVGCESCHGPGKRYRGIHRKAAKQFEKKKKSTPRSKLVAAGEEFEFVERCKSCHLNYEGSPWAKAKKPYTPFTPEVDAKKYNFDFDKYLRNEKGMHEHFKLQGVFEGQPQPSFHQEFQDAAKPTSAE